MPKFLVTIQQRVIEEKCIEIEAANEGEAEHLVRNSADFRDGDDFEFVHIPDKWIESVEPWVQTEEDEDA